MCVKEGTLQAYLDGELDADTRAGIAAHLSDCERCRARAAAAAERHARVAEVMPRRLADADPAPAAAALARFRERLAATGHAGVYVGGPPRSWRFSPVLGASLAAGVLSGVAIAALLSGHATRHPARGLVAGTQTAGTPVATQSQDRPLPVTPVPAKPDRAPIHGPSPRSRAFRHRPAINQYFLLTTDVNPPEIGIVVRIKVPLSMVTTRPATLPADAADPQLEADVLVGQDGRPRAIRFVNQTVTPGGK